MYVECVGGWLKIDDLCGCICPAKRLLAGESQAQRVNGQSKFKRTQCNVLTINERASNIIILYEEISFFIEKFLNNMNKLN